MPDEIKTPMNEAEVETETTDSAETTTIGEPAQVSSEDVIASKKDVDAVLEAVKELTKIVGELHKENIKWFRAGKMGGPNG